MARMLEPVRSLGAETTPITSRDERRALWTRIDARVLSICLVGFLIALVCLRSWVFLWFPGVHIDSDQAVLGLMGKDIARGEAWSLFTYGRRYMLAIGAWLCAPLFALFGASVTTLKFPMFAMNVGCVVMLWFGLRKERGLGVWGAALSVLPFAAVSVVTASRLVEHAGGNIEPIFFLILAYLLRERAVALGLVLGIAYLNREYTPIGLIALLICDALQGTLRMRAKLYAIALGTAGLVIVVIRLIAEHGANYVGPVPNFEPQNVFDGRGLFGYMLVQLPLLLGSARIELAPYVGSRLHAGQDLLRFVVWAWLLLGAAGIAAALKRKEVGGMASYLVLVGLGQVAAFMLFCSDPYQPMLLRYVLPSVLAWVGFTAFAWMAPVLRPWIGLVVLLVAAANVRDHVRVAREWVLHPIHTEHEKLAEALVKRGVHYAEADYWVAYDVTWLADERVIITPPAGNDDRIARYRAELTEHRAEARLITDRPCKHGKRILRWYLCPLPKHKH